MSDGIFRLAIGEQFAPGVTYGDQERFEYRYTNGQHLLQINMPRLKPSEIESFRNGKIHVGLYARGASIFVLFRIEGFMDWSDQAFSLFALPPEARAIEPVKEGEHILLTMVLVESTTGVCEAFRALTYSTHMSSTFYRLLRRQVDEGLTAEQHARNVAATYEQFPQSKLMARAALCTERAGLVQPGDRNAK